MIRVAWALSAAFVVDGCSDLGTPLEPKPESQLSTTVLQFGTIALGQAALRSVVVSNSGTGALQGQASLSCLHYAIESGGGSFTLAPGQSRTITVRFMPGAVGDFSCQLELGADTPPVALEGHGALQSPGANGTTLPESLAFGGVAVGASRMGSFSILSSGTAPVLVDVTSSCPDFQIVTGGGTTLVPPGLSVTVVVRYQPSAGGPAHCSITVGPGFPEVGVSGTGLSISFAADVRPIFYNNCSSCHWDFADDSDHDTYPFLVMGLRPVDRIVPGDLANSRIYNRIADTGLLGTRMPPTGPAVTPAEIQVIRQWILEGALEN